MIRNLVPNFNILRVSVVLLNCPTVICNKFTKPSARLVVSLLLTKFKEVLAALVLTTGASKLKALSLISVCI